MIFLKERSALREVNSNQEQREGRHGINYFSKKQGQRNRSIQHTKRPVTGQWKCINIFTYNYVLIMIS